MKPLVKTGLLIAVCLLGFALVCVSTAMIWTNRGHSQPQAAFNIGKTETHSSLSSSSTSSSLENSTFSSRRVLLVADEPHPLSRRIARLLAQKLKDCPQIEQLDTTNSPVMLPEGAVAPDLFLRVDLVELKTTGVLAFSGSMKATVTASLGNSPWQSSSYSSDDATPPLVNFIWNAMLDSESTFTGLRSDRYAAAAESIAEELAKAIRKEIEELSTKYPALPEVPAGFYGPYQPVADFEFLKMLKATHACSYCSLLSHNQTFWLFQTATNPVPELQNMIRQLEAAGWKFSSVNLTNTADYYVRCRRSGTELEIFRDRSDQMSFRSAAKPEAAIKFIAHYRQPFSRAEREAALEKLFAEQRPVETLLPFRNSLSRAQRDAFYALIEKSPATSPQACVQLADIYLNRKQTNDALNMLLRAKALTATLKDATTLQSSIEGVAKKISPKKTLKLEVTPEICRELGFLEITNLTQTVEQERAFGQALVFFGPGERGIRIFALTISPPQKKAYPWFMVQAEDGMRSSSWSSFTPTTRGDWRQSFNYDQQTVNIVAIPLPDQKRVKLTIQVGP